MTGYRYYSEAAAASPPDASPRCAHMGFGLSRHLRELLRHL